MSVTRTMSQAISPSTSHRLERGFTVAELITVVAIIGLLAAMVVPVARFGLRREKEVQLRASIRRITDAIDRYHDLAVKQQLKERVSVEQGDYPKDLDQLVKGVDTVDGKHVYLLREREEIDPMTGEKDWIFRSSTDNPETTDSNHDNIYDVHCPLTTLALDGKTHYNEW
jgi:general secretion pathway protein G